MIDGAAGPLVGPTPSGDRERPGPAAPARSGAASPLAPGRPRAALLALALALAVGGAAILVPRPADVGPAAASWLGRSLVSTDPTPPRVDAVAVHGGGSPARERERPALALLRAGAADTLVAMGGPLPPPDPDVTYAGATARRLRELGAPPGRVVALPEGLSTRGELEALRRLAARRGWHRVALATSPWHTLRLRLVAQEVLAGSGLAWSIVAGPDEAADWWRRPDERAARLGEWLKIAQLLGWPSHGRL